MLAARTVDTALGAISGQPHQGFHVRSAHSILVMQHHPFHSKPFGRRHSGICGHGSGAAVGWQIPAPRPRKKGINRCGGKNTCAAAATPLGNPSAVMQLRPIVLIRSRKGHRLKIGPYDAPALVDDTTDHRFRP
jgi:hypothetical protein